MESCLCIFVLFHLTNLCTLVTSASSQPNILFVLVDDLGWSDVGFHGSKIKTPNIDKLASDGVVLENYYVQPICSPTRGALLSGKYPIHIGKYSFIQAHLEFLTTHPQNSFLTARTRLKSSTRSDRNKIFITHPNCTCNTSF